MELSEKEVNLIKSAIKERKSKRYAQWLLIVLMLLSILGMYFGVIDSKEFSYVAFALVGVTVLHSYHYKSASYDQLLDILNKRVPDNSLEAQVADLRKHG